MQKWDDSKNERWRLISGFLSSLRYQKRRGMCSSKLPWLNMSCGSSLFEFFYLGTTSDRESWKVNMLSVYAIKFAQSIESFGNVFYKSSFTALFLCLRSKLVKLNKTQTTWANALYRQLMLKALQKVKLVKFCRFLRFTSTTLPGAPHSLGNCCFWQRSWTHVLHYVQYSRWCVSRFSFRGRVFLFTQFS